MSLVSPNSAPRAGWCSSQMRQMACCMHQAPIGSRMSCWPPRRSGTLTSPGNFDRYPLHGCFHFFRGRISDVRHHQSTCSNETSLIILTNDSNSSFVSTPRNSNICIYFDRPFPGGIQCIAFNFGCFLHFPFI